MLNRDCELGIEYSFVIVERRKDHLDRIGLGLDPGEDPEHLSYIVKNGINIERKDRRERVK
jgi:hypothetical protein